MEIIGCCVADPLKPTTMTHSLRENAFLFT